MAEPSSERSLSRSPRAHWLPTGNPNEYISIDDRIGHQLRHQNSTQNPPHKPCCRCPAFVAEYTHSTICMISTARWRPTKRCPMPHAPKLDRRHA